MRTQINFDELDLFCAEYSEYTFFNSSARIKLVDGLGVSDLYKPLFARKYLHDQQNDIKYDKWVFLESGLSLHLDKTKNSEENWVLCKNPYDIESLLKYEFVGNCFLIFDKCQEMLVEIALYNEGGKSLSGEIYKHEYACEHKIEDFMERYIIEGVIKNGNQTGWAKFTVLAAFFHVEIAVD